jgi:uncharacterized protein with HEPN domain
MRGKIGDKVRLQHILDAIIEIETYSLNTDFSGFMKNSMMRFACIKQMEIIKSDLPGLKEKIIEILNSMI